MSCVTMATVGKHRSEDDYLNNLVTCHHFKAMLYFPSSYTLSSAIKRMTDVF